MRRSRVYVIAACLAAVVLSACATTGVVQEREHEFGTYHLYVPDSYTTESNVVAVVHGMPGENEDVVALAETFINRWTDFADTTGAVIVSPAFDQENFASHSGGHGGYRGLYGREVGADEFLHSILDEVGLVLAPTSERRFFLYGHSAGGQFASRYVVRHPERVLGVVLSAPGRYAFPDETVSWHFGMGRVEREITWPDGEQQEIDITPDAAGWVQAAGLPIAIVIGDQDTAPQPCRPAHCDDGENETTRIAIGERWVDEMNALAASDGGVGRVRMELVSGVGHNSAALTGDAQEVLHNLIAGRVSVPDVVGMSGRQAMDILQSASLEGRIGERILSERPRGEIALQHPGADNWVDRGSVVVLNPSLGVEQPPDRTTVPDVVGQTLLNARPAVEAAGFTPRPVFVDSDRPFEEVIRQIPAAGEQAAPGSEVRLFTSRGSGEIP